MQIVYSRCCGLDVHKKIIVGCLLLIEADGTRHREVRSFGTMTRDLLQMLDWLQAARCTHVAMESTGVYWKPVYTLLEAHFSVLLINPQHIKAVPGRKTDVKDAEWIADLLAHGLLSPSFIPPAPQRELRELTRTRTTLVQERARVINRIQKVLEDTNIKLASVVSNIMGVSARAMLTQLLDGHSDPEQLATLARGRLRQKREQVQEALVGVFQPHHRFLLSGHLTHVDFLDEHVEQLDQEIARRLDPPPPDEPRTPPAPEREIAPVADSLESGRAEDAGPSDMLERLEQVPGIGRRVAQIIVAEVGTDMSRFPSDKHLASWAGLCPGNKQSAGKRLSGRTGSGNGWLRAALVEAAHGAARSKDTFLGEQYRRLSRRMGRKKALIAVAHSILVIVYHLLKQGTAFRELGTQFVQEREREQATQRAVKRLEGLGFQVHLEPVVSAA